THSTEPLRYQADHENERRWLTWDLLCGRRNGLSSRLREIGIGEAELAWFEENPCPPDVVGVNHYLSSERFLDHRLEHYPERLHGGNGKHRYADELAARVLGRGPDGPAKLLLEAWRRYRLPLAVTEVHNGCTREEQLRWFDEVWQAAEAARRRGADMRAVTVWSLLGTFGWADLLIGGARDYEPGLFDVRAPQPRPTALAHMARRFARGKPFDHAAADGVGWWRRPERLWYPPVGAVARAPVRRTRPLLVTGATGTLGSAFARICDERGLKTVVTTRDRLDAADAHSVEAALRTIEPWAIVNAAGYVDVDGAERELPKCYRENTLAAETLSRAAAGLGIPLVTFSTDLVFDGRKPTPYEEEDGCRPLNVYGASKLAAERVVLNAADRALVVRTSAFFGPWDEHNFVTCALRALATGRSFAAAADLVVSPTYVPDLVHATLDLLIDGERGIWHLSNASAVTWLELAALAAEAAEMDASGLVSATAAEVGWTAPRPAQSALASSRAWIMAPLEDALVRYVGAASYEKLRPGKTERREMSEHYFEDELEERDDVVDTPTDVGEEGDSPREGEPWAKASSGDADDVTSD
ncbi:MAG TPA: SDR family oxidoreductase, partial [Gaiellaceae bacterium]|nr:SDR family oxidoreductase [Gaiellaceae bacterium]